MRCISLLLKPLSWLYGLGIKIRHFLYDRGFFASISFEEKIIKIGNLSFGGTGKSPMTLYIAEHYLHQYTVYILSRGYGRKTNDIREVKKDSSVEEVGDEPLMLKWIQPHLNIIVSKDRVEGIRYIQAMDKAKKIIILDDALQHRRLNGGYTILLTDAQKPFISDSLFPSGTLRDVKSRAKHSNMIVLSKSDLETKSSGLDKKIEQYSGKYILLSQIKYDDFIDFFIGEKIEIDSKILAVSGIANPSSFYQYIEQFAKIQILSYPDHYLYKSSDIQKWVDICKLQNITQIITTYKDAVKLTAYRDIFQENNIVLVVLPIRTYFEDNEKKILFNNIETYLQS